MAVAGLNISCGVGVNPAAVSDALRGTTEANRAASETTQLLLEQLTQSLQGMYGLRLLGYAQGNAGQLPYYWQDPSSLAFNQLTYEWISSSLAARRSGNSVVLSGQSFAELYRQVISQVGYCLSQADSVTLARARARAAHEQKALLDGWRHAYGSLPSADGSAVDGVLGSVLGGASQGPATLMDVLSPARPYPVSVRGTQLPLGVEKDLSRYLVALGGALGLQSDVAVAYAKLSHVRDAASAPSAANGGMTMDDGTGNFVPAFEMHTALPDILNGLAGASAVALELKTVSRSPIVDERPGASSVAASDPLVELSMKFTGITLVQFAPAAYDDVSKRGWYWEEPVQAAIRNRNRDVTGYCFTSIPQIDFSSRGPFGFVNAAVISNMPTIRLGIRETGSDGARVSRAAAEQPIAAGGGLPLGEGQRSVAGRRGPSGADIDMTLALSPAPELVALSPKQRRAWVIAVQVSYPGERDATARAAED